MIFSIRKIKTSLDKKYSYLLIALMATFIFAAFVTRGISQIALSFFFLYTMITIVETFSRKPHLFKIYNLIVICSFVLEIIAGLEETGSTALFYTTVGQIIHIFYLSVAIYLIFRDILTSHKVTIDTILGSICIYFLMGILWALMYALCRNFTDDAFSQSLGDQEYFRTLIHFSFTTLTTVGYGDISPTNSLTRMLSNLQGIIGQMYPAILVSILVSIYTSQKVK